MNIPEMLARANKFLSNNSPTLLTMVAVGGVAKTTFEAIRATPKAMWLVNERSIYINRDLEPLEIAQLVWKEYVRTAIFGGLTIACIIGSNTLNQRRNAALASIYALTESTLKEYQEKVKEVVSSRKAEEIQDKMSEAKLEKHKLKDAEVIILEKGDVLFFDELSHRYFKSQVEHVRSAVNTFNHDLLNQDLYKPLNDFYDLIGLPEMPLGRDIGWEVNDRLLDIHFSAKMADENIPCIALNYDRSLPKKL